MTEPDETSYRLNVDIQIQAGTLTREGTNRYWRPGYGNESLRVSESFDLGNITFDQIADVLKELHTLLEMLRRNVK